MHTHICTSSFLTHFNNIQNISRYFFIYFFPFPFTPFFFYFSFLLPPLFVSFLFLSFLLFPLSVFSSVTLEHTHTHTHTHTYMCRPARTLPRVHITSQAALQRDKYHRNLLPDTVHIRQIPPEPASRYSPYKTNATGTCFPIQSILDKYHWNLLPDTVNIRQIPPEPASRYSLF